MNVKINPSTLKIPTKAYSQTMLVPCGETRLLFISGQLPQDKSGTIQHEGDIGKQTKFVFENIFRILVDAKMGYEDVVKLQIFIKNPEDVSIVSRIRDEFFLEIRPASTLVVVSGFAREGSGIEIDVVAAKATKTV